MTSRERLLKVLRGEIPDCVPVAPDFSNMIPAKRTGKPFWDVYLYNNPPIWEAYIECAKYFDIDSLMDGYFWFNFPWDLEKNAKFEAANPRYIVSRTPERIVTQRRGPDGWHPTVDVFWRDLTPAWNTPPSDIDLPAEPAEFELLTGVKRVDLGLDGLKRVKEQIGDQGLVGIFVASSCFIHNPDQLYEFIDHPEKKEEIKQTMMAECERRMVFLRDLPVEYRPDFLCFGGSGTLVLQTLEMVKEMTLPVIKRGMELAKEYGYFTHVHSCGPEAELVKLFSEETTLTVIDPLEIPPMGDCNLAELKQKYGDKIVLKGNLHTTNVMLNGSVEEVKKASRQAIDDAAKGGRFILSTGDQCGRDTPEENLRAMVEIARTYGKY